MAGGPRHLPLRFAFTQVEPAALTPGPHSLAQRTIFA